MTDLLWEVFFTPHTDDETIGMAGSIIRARRANRPVLVVLVTDNLPSTRGTRIFPEHDVSVERRREWKRAMAVLDVAAIEQWEMSDVSMEEEPATMQRAVQERILVLLETYHVRRLHTTWGSDDLNELSGTQCRSHEVCANALRALSDDHPSVVMALHGVYIYSREAKERTAPTILCLSDDEMALKQRALDCYRPIGQSIGYGFASVPEIIDAASVDSREFIIEI